MVLFAAAVAALMLGVDAPRPVSESLLVAVAKCTGADECKACKTCSGCAHCSQPGKSCGVCKDKPASRPSTQPTTQPATRPSR